LNRGASCEDICPKRPHRTDNYVDLGQTSVDGEYYVVRDPATRKCRVVDERPAGAADMVGLGPVKSWADAEKGMRDSKVCASAEHDNGD
jgi:hypothetical protein